MPLTLDWSEVGVRLFFTILAGALIGWNRGETGHPAGLRTTLLVCLAASVAMIESNLLLDTRGKAWDSFAVLDLARYPLGILTGIGFIGAGAILHRGSLIEGVTTAATLWFVTVVGLCFGGGQLALGIAATIIGFLVLTLLKRAEDYLPVDRRATIDLIVEGDSPRFQSLTTDGLTGDGLTGDGLAGDVAKRGYRLVERGSTVQTNPARRQILYELHWRAPAGGPAPKDWLDGLAARPGVVQLAWRMGPRADRNVSRPPIL
ncbi:MAG: MgtC/SapB family protein [Stellaceae bacterium]